MSAGGFKRRTPNQVAMTHLYGILGDPIGHSLSPAMHMAAFRALRLDAIYSAFEVPPRFLRPVLRALVLAGVEGLNVTVPLKEVIIPLLDEVDPTAEAIGAVNTIVIRQRRTMGYNTDGAGFSRAVRELGWHPAPGCAVVLGAGGAARAVLWELTRQRGRGIVLANRHQARAQRLARWLRKRRPSASIDVVRMREVPLAEADLLVNATSVGMRPTDQLLVDPRALHPGLRVYDLVYHRETPLVRAARRRGCVAANGASMLLYQGVESLRLWLNRAPPLAAMRPALERALRGAQR